MNKLKQLTLLFIALIVAIPTLCASQTKVSIVGNQFYINGKPTYEGRMWNGKPVEGLLMNSRMVNGIFDDLNPETRETFKYPDTGVWDADRNTDEFIEAMEEWYSYGLLSFTLNLQGGSPIGYGNNGWINSAFDKDGAFRDDYKGRLKRVLDKADDLGMVVMLGYFYFGADEYLTDEQAVVRATKEATQWILDEGYENVMIEVANECNIHYDHEILKPAKIWTLIDMIKGMSKDGRRLLVSASFSGHRFPTAKICEVSDFILLHGNSIKDPKVMREFIHQTREKFPEAVTKPVVVNEDDHYNYDAEESNFSVSTEEYVSWGFFDYRRKGESFEEGYQSIPADWGISSQRKREFFEMVREITGCGKEPLWQGKGRIAISSDGNEHDDDDWAATPLSLALIASQGLQDKLTLYTYSDHVWGNNQAQGIKGGMTAYEHMKESALGAKKRFGFDKTTFFCAVDAPAKAYRMMAEAINASSYDNPLLIIAAGPMQVVGEGLNQAEKSKLKYVTVLTHSWWNNKHADNCGKAYWDQHTGWTFDEMVKAFGPNDKGGVKFVEIADQNGGKDYLGLQAPIPTFDWIKTSKARKNKAYQKGSWDWLYSRLESCPKVKGGVDVFDPSDAGMLVYIFTGEEKTSPDMARELMENPKTK